MRFFYMVAWAMLAAAPLHAMASNRCGNVRPLETERSALRQTLDARGIARAERNFLLAGIDERLVSISNDTLNPSGAQCGAKVVRAMIFACIRKTLPAMASPGMVDKSLWGRSGLSKDAAVVIGMTHACRASALEALAK